MPAPPTNNEPVVGALVQVWTSIVGVGEQVRGTQWDLPTDCPGWTVRDQLSHLIGIERLLLGDPPPPPLAEFPGHVTNAFGEMNEAWVDARRRTPGPTVLAEFVEVTNRRIDDLRSMPTSRFDEVGWSPLGEIPYRQFMETRILDSWVHEQDIRRALGRPGGRNGVGEATALDRCGDTMPYVVGKRVAPPDGTSVLFAVVGVMGRQVLVAVDGGRAVPLAVTPEVRPTVTLTMDQESFWRLGFGRVEPKRLLATAQVKVDGDVALGHRVLDAMSFMI
jgi:uncharacterized protein (TIGR03083 family)